MLLPCNVCHRLAVPEKDVAVHGKVCWACRSETKPVPEKRPEPKPEAVEAKPKANKKIGRPHSEEALAVYPFRLAKADVAELDLYATSLGVRRSEAIRTLIRTLQTQSGK